MSETANPCGNCGEPLRGERGYTGQAAYHRTCAKRVYGDEFRQWSTFEDYSLNVPGTWIMRNPA